MSATKFNPWEPGKLESLPSDPLHPTYGVYRQRGQLFLVCTPDWHSVPIPEFATCRDSLRSAIKVHWPERLACVSP